MRCDAPLHKKSRVGSDEEEEAGRDIESFELNYVWVCLVDHVCIGRTLHALHIITLHTLLTSSLHTLFTSSLFTHSSHHSSHTPHIITHSSHTPHIITLHTLTSYCCSFSGKSFRVSRTINYECVWTVVTVLRERNRKVNCTKHFWTEGRKWRQTDTASDQPSVSCSFFTAHYQFHSKYKELMCDWVLFWVELLCDWVLFWVS